MFHSVSLLSQAPLARGSCALPSVLFLSFFPFLLYHFFLFLFHFPFFPFLFVFLALPPSLPQSFYFFVIGIKFRSPHNVFTILVYVGMYVGMYVVFSTKKMYSRMHGRSYVSQTRACSKSVLVVKPICDTQIILSTIR